MKRCDSTARAMDGEIVHAGGFVVVNFSDCDRTLSEIGESFLYTKKHGIPSWDIQCGIEGNQRLYCDQIDVVYLIS